MELVQGMEEFIRERYYAELLKAAKEDHALVIDFSELDRFDPVTADQLLESPRHVLETMQKAVESFSLGEKVNVRIRNIPESRNIRIRNLRAKHMNRLWCIDAIIKAASEVKPQIYKATFICPECGTPQEILQEGNILQKAFVCQCGRRGDFGEPTDKKMFDVRWLTGVEPFEITTGEQPGEIRIILKEDLTTPKMQKKTDPGSRLRIVGILIEAPKYIKGKLSTKLDMFFEAVHVETKDIEFEEIDITPEDERKIKELASDPNIYERLKLSIAPGIYGFDEIKESIALQLFGGNKHRLPDGNTIRGNIHILLTGDPGCLVGDERIVLGNGAIVKIRDIGKKHLQNIDISVLTGEGGKKRDRAAIFHLYKNHPILEVITESGKSIKGTYNHPLMCIYNENGTLRRKWKRLDEIRTCDRLAVITSIPCTITRHVETGFGQILQKYGPKFKGRLPKYWDEDLAAFAGYVLGDGWVRKYETGFVVAEQEIDILGKLLKLSEKLFSKKNRIENRKIINSMIGSRIINRKQKLVYVYIDSRTIADNLHFLRFKRIPDTILASGNKVVASFLRWLYEADGSVFDKGRGNRSINLKSSSLELLRDVQMLLLRFSIHSRILGGNNLMIRRGESIIKFAKYIGFASEKKCNKIAQLAKSAKDFKRFNSQRSERVVKIIRHPPADVYDIEVPLSHRFIANGIISHNTGKSQMLKLVSSIIPRGKYVSGSGVTGAGMTATVRKDEVLGGWVLEAGALILANRGIISIDEFDKISRDDQIAMHEAMSIETVSIAKASIVATLPAETAVLAGANPKFGRFDPYMPIADQITIPETLLSRFDMKFAIRDRPDRTQDERLADHIILSRTKPELVEPAISMTLLRKYIAYAKQIIHMELGEEASQRLKEFYVDMRNRYTGEDINTISITLRQYEALIRLAEASAKVRLDTRIRIEDAERAIRLMKYSLSQLGYDYETGRIDIDRVEGGMPAGKRKKIHQVVEIIESLQKSMKEVPIEDVKAAAEEQGLGDIDEIIEKLKSEGTLFEPRIGFIKKAR